MKSLPASAPDSSIFTATIRSRPTCRARYTMPMRPRAISSSEFVFAKGRAGGASNRGNFVDTFRVGGGQNLAGVKVSAQLEKATGTKPAWGGFVQQCATLRTSALGVPVGLI